VDGMIIEQEQVVTAFVFSLFCLALSLMGTYGIMMTFPAAGVTSVFTFFGMIMWYHYSLRIYNRFRFEAKLDWQSQSDALDEQFPDPDEYARGMHGKIRSETGKDYATKKAGLAGMARKGFMGVFGAAGGAGKGDDNGADEDPSRGSLANTTDASFSSAVPGSQPYTDKFGNETHQAGAGSGGDLQMYSGYLSMKSGGMFSSPWVRR
jgi:uncharacterized membrane protein